MQTYYVATRVSNDGTLIIKGLPFRPGDKVEVTVRSRERERKDSTRCPLIGKPIRYVDPFGSVAEGEWDVLK